ncbi:MAG TPA: hypothetical protein PK906_03105 [Spirochaetota bacterium]|nr:hypothetical protein [Spirochaetota bacterium]
MAKKLITYLSAITITASAILFSVAAEKSGYRERFVDFLEKSAGSGEKEKSGTVFIDNGQSGPSGYSKGDWHEYTSDKASYYFLKSSTGGNIYSGEDFNIDSYGTASLKLQYGKSYFTNSKYKQYDEDSPVSRVITEGFFPEQVVQLHVEGKVGERITVYIDHDSTRSKDENHYLMQYRAGSDEELIREINAGEIDIKFNHSKYAVYDNTDAKGLGVDLTIGRDSFFVKAFGSISRGITAVEYFTGNSSRGSIKLSEYQYVRRTYYQLEPFVRYDGVTVTPTGAGVYSLVTLTSAPASPSTYSLNQVGISSEGFVLYMDDQNQYNNLNAIQFPLDGGYYTKLVNGTDYSINYTTGAVTFLKTVNENARIFAAYNRSGGTLDPCAIPPGDASHPGGIFTGKIIVFIKYGYSLNEDVVTRDFAFNAGETDSNGDGRVNLDVYEIRSYYYLGSKSLLSENFALSFAQENSEMTSADISSLSPYSVDQAGGLLKFTLREPYRSLLGASAGDIIYSEKYLNDTYLYSRFNINSEYCIDSRIFQLNHSNIIKNSVRIKVAKKEITRSLYSVDHESGFITFTNSTSPVIGPNTEIEIKYEYLPMGVATNSFQGGVRADYELTRDIKIGGSVMVSKDNEGEVVPDVGDETKQTNLFEGDVLLTLTSKRLSQIFKALTGRRSLKVPAEFTAYGEYAKSFQNINTFGKALVDNMESTDDIVAVSLSEKEWILSSMPAGLTQGDRALLYYYYYRDPDSPESLRGAGFNPYTVAYSVKPGPFNIAMGHIDDAVTDQDSQKSLVFDFDFSSGECFSAVTRRLSSEAVDLSGMQYVEMWVRLDGGSSIDLYADFGAVNEDSDGDGILDKEDSNSNGYIDATPTTGYSEDRGYTFNGTNQTVVGSGPGLSSSTKGDGILNTEDLDGNGTLDTSESVYTVSLGTLNNTSGGWVKIKINIDSLTSSDINILKQTSSIRLYGRQNSGTTGRLYVDSFRVVSSLWKNMELDGVSVDNSNIINISLLNTLSDSDYRGSSFLYKESGLYESLYGSGSIDDINSQSETALQIDYNIPVGNSTVSVTRNFSRKLDIRFYKTLNVWVNARSIDASNTISFILGSSDNDYVEYRAVPAGTLSWEKVSLKLSGDSDGSVEKYLVQGKPDFRRIKYMKIGINGADTSGSIWFNEIYVSEPETLEGSAHWYETNLKILAPLAKTDAGTPILSDVKIRYVNRGHSTYFNSLNKTTADISENYNEVHASSRVLPYLKLDMDYIREKAVSDSIDENIAYDKRGETVNNQFQVNTVFSSTGGAVPTVVFNYMMANNLNRKSLETSGVDYREKSDDITHTPVISWEQNFGEFLFGKLNFKAGMDMMFNESTVNRDALNSTNSVLASYANLEELDKRQQARARVHLNYSAGKFYLRPALESFSNEVVKLKGSDDDLGIGGDVNGGFHLPFMQTERMKFLERNNSLTLSTGYRGTDYVAPEYSMGMYYRENSFSDYSDNVIIGEGFERSKSGISNFQTRIRLPVMLGRMDIFKNLKMFQINFARSVMLTETDVPYEGEGTGYFNEDYGVSRVYSKLSSGAYNLLSRWPGYFFFGRGNYANGRDFVYGKLNENLPVMETAAAVEYNNSLSLQEDISADLQLSVSEADITLTGALGQNCQRSDIYGVPSQVITADLGVNSEFDLLRILRGSGGRNFSGGLFNSIIVSTGVDYSDNMIITANTDEQKVSPSLGFTFKMDRSSFKIHGGLDYRVFRDHEFIDTGTAEGDEDYIYLENMTGNESFKEEDFGYKLNMAYETDVQWIYDYFSLVYKLTGIPVFSLEYIMQIDRYNYTDTVSPEPYDLYQLKSGLTLNLHENVKGMFAGGAALENYRNRSDETINSQVLSYEVSWKFTLIF